MKNKRLKKVYVVSLAPSSLDRSWNFSSLNLSGNLKWTTHLCFKGIPEYRIKLQPTSLIVMSTLWSHLDNKFLTPSRNPSYSVSEEHVLSISSGSYNIMQLKLMKTKNKPFNSCTIITIVLTQYNFISY